MTYTCQLIDRAAQPVLSIRTHTSVQQLPEQLGRAYGAIVEYLADMGERPAGPPFAVYYNMDMQNLDVEMGFPVATPLSGEDAIQANLFAKGQYAMCVHNGPYGDIGAAYEALTVWMQDHGYTPTGIAYEFYLNDADETPPEELQTQIFFPVKGQ